MERNADRVGARAHPDGLRGVSSPAEAILVRPLRVECRWATGAWDASADALPGAMEDEHLEPQHHPDGGAEKLAARAPDVQEPDAQSLPPERLARRA